MDLRRLEPFALEHHGLVSRSAAAGLGISTSSWYRAIESHLLEPVSKNVVRLIGVPITREQRILAAVWSAGSDAFASHRSAAYLWGVDRPAGDPIDVMLSKRSREATVADVVIHRPRDLRDMRFVMRSKIPCARPARVLCDLGAVDDQGVYDALEQILATKVVTAKAVRAALKRHAKSGHDGITALRAALDRWQLHERVPPNVLEAKMMALLRTEGLPAATFHARVEGYEVDFLVDGTPVVIECDGYGAHGLDREQFEFDRVRNAELLAGGHPVVHVTWLQITKSPVATASRIRAVIARWAPAALAGTRST